MRRGTAALLLLGSAPVALPLAAQEPPRYTAASLACAAFAETVRTTVRAQEAGLPWEETGTRAGVLVVRARATGTQLAFEAWYDSLTIVAETRTGRVVPDTDGLVGGRWQGILTPSGAVALRTRPFIPEEVRAVSDLAEAPLDFFPPLPTAAIPPNAGWTDSLGLTIRRLPDSSATARYRWTIRSRSAPVLEADTTVRLRQQADEEGQVAWDAVEGAMRWARDVTVETQVMQGQRNGRAYRGRVAQQIAVRRLRDHPACR